MSTFRFNLLHWFLFRQSHNSQTTILQGHTNQTVPPLQREGTRPPAPLPRPGYLDLVEMNDERSYASAEYHHLGMPSIVAYAEGQGRAEGETNVASSAEQESPVVLYDNRCSGSAAEMVYAAVCENGDDAGHMDPSALADNWVKDRELFFLDAKTIMIMGGRLSTSILWDIFIQ